MTAPNLDQTQRLLWKLITAPEGAAAGLAQLGPADRRCASALVCGDERLSAIERLDIYANMYFYRMRDALKEDFSAVCSVVGDTTFHNLITDYLIARPPSHFSLRYAGKHFPPFLRRHPSSCRWPFLADLANLEWAILDAFDAADAPVLEAPALAGVPQERWPELRFQLTPALRLLDLDWPVHEVWKHTQCGEPPAQPAPCAITLRVWRQNFRVYHRRIDTTERIALVTISEGASFAAVCERIVACDSEARGTERAAALLGEWLGDGLLSSFSFPGLP
ncbi:MAG: DUF2063 domain-containing protein [Candidatus Binatia bacterium]